MTITVGQNSYVTLAEYEVYCCERNITIDYTSIDSALVLSSDFIDTYYTFKGQPLANDQAMQLPTTEVSIFAISKAALKAVELQQAGRLSLDASTLSGALVASESKSLDGVGSKSVTYESGSQVTYKPRVPELDLLLRPYIRGAGGLMRG